MCRSLSRMSGRATGVGGYRPGSYPTVNERTPVEIPFFGRCEGIYPLISGWFQIHVNKPTQPIPGRRIKTSAQTWRGGLFVYSCLEPAVHRAHPLPTLDIKGNFTGLPYGAAGKEPGLMVPLKLHRVAWRRSNRSHGCYRSRPPCLIMANWANIPCLQKSQVRSSQSPLRLTLSI